VVIVEFYPAKIYIPIRTERHAKAFVSGFKKAQGHDFESLTNELSDTIAWHERGVSFFFPLFNFCRKWSIKEFQTVSIIQESKYNEILEKRGGYR
jgi:hypothetical protein